MTVRYLLAQTGGELMQVPLILPNVLPFVLTHFDMGAGLFSLHADHHPPCMKHPATACITVILPAMYQCMQSMPSPAVLAAG